MISKRLRYEILRRDDYACRYCGAKAPDAQLEVDHVQPTALGGSDEPNNLITACVDCNAGKSSTPADAPLVEQVDVDAARWTAAMEKAAEVQRRRKGEVDEYIAAFDEAWGGWTLTSGEVLMRPDNWRSSIERFFEQGLEPEVLAEAVNITMNTKRLTNVKTFKYFCGICWNKVRERQTIARALAERDQDEPGAE